MRNLLIAAGACLGIGVVMLIFFGKEPSARVDGTGSTFIAPMMETWRGEYRRATGTTVDYQAVGSGPGIKRLQNPGIFDFACTDSPLNAEQLAKLKADVGDVVFIPLVLGAVVLAHNLDEIHDTLTFPGIVLAKIYLRKIKKWNDPAIQEFNPGLALPDLDITVVHRSEPSGTTSIWTEYLSKVSSEWKDKVGVGTAVNWPTGVAAPGNNGVAQRVKTSRGAIGYVELNSAISQGLRYGRVKNREGRPMIAIPESVTAAAKASLSKIPDDLRLSIVYAPGKDSYPISSISWAVTFAKPEPGAKKKTVDFLRWATHEGQAFVEEAHYCPLPEELVKLIDKKLDAIACIRAAADHGK